MGSVPYWFPVITLIAGALLTVLGDYLRDRRADSRRRQLERDEFERRTLIELQDAIDRLTTATRHQHRADLKHHEETGEWSPKEAPVEEVFETYIAAESDVHRLRSRLRDADLQKEIIEFLNVCTFVTLPVPEGFDSESVKAKAEEAYRKMWDEKFMLDSRLGDAISDIS